MRCRLTALDRKWNAGSRLATRKAYPVASKKRQPLRWRVNDDGAKGFDEIVVGIGQNPCLLHAEMMSKDAMFVTVGHLAIWVRIDKNGNAVVQETEWRGPSGTAPSGGVSK